MTANVNGPESGVLLSRLCLVVGVVGGLMAILQPALGVALSVIALVWASACQRGTSQRGYRLALIVSLAALVMNITVPFTSLSVASSIPDPLPAVKIR